MYHRIHLKAPKLVWTLMKRHTLEVTSRSVPNAFQKWGWVSTADSPWTSSAMPNRLLRWTVSRHQKGVYWLTILSPSRELTLLSTESICGIPRESQIYTLFPNLRSRRPMLLFLSTTSHPKPASTWFQSGSKKLKTWQRWEHPYSLLETKPTLSMIQSWLSKTSPIYRESTESVGSVSRAWNSPASSNSAFKISLRKLFSLVIEPGLTSWCSTTTSRSLFATRRSQMLIFRYPSSSCQWTSRKMPSKTTL